MILNAAGTAGRNDPLRSFSLTAVSSTVILSEAKNLFPYPGDMGKSPPLLHGMTVYGACYAKYH